MGQVVINVSGIDIKELLELSGNIVYFKALAANVEIQLWFSFGTKTVDVLKYMLKNKKQCAVANQPKTKSSQSSKTENQSPLQKQMGSESINTSQLK